MTIVNIIGAGYKEDVVCYIFPCKSFYFVILILRIRSKYNYKALIKSSVSILLK